MPGNDMLKTTTDILGRLLSASNIMGPPIEAENKVIIPFAGFGFGFGGGEGKDGGTQLGGSGSGAGAGLDPVAVLVLHKDVAGREGVQLLPLRKLSPIAEAASETIPIVVDSIPKVMHEVRGTVGDVIQQVKGPAKQAAKQMGGPMKEMAEAATEGIQEATRQAGAGTSAATEKVKADWEEWKGEGGSKT